MLLKNIILETQVWWWGGHAVFLSHSLVFQLLNVALFVGLFSNNFFFFKTVTCQTFTFISIVQFIWFIFLFFASSTRASSCYLLSSPLLALYFTQCLYDSLLLIFPFSIPLTLSSSPFLLPLLLLGSLLTLLNVRAQTSPCRAAPSHKGQKQLVSLPFPCFLAASVCLTVCLLQACHPLFHSLIHCLLHFKS